jgi:serine protease Do
MLQNCRVAPRGAGLVGWLLGLVALMAPALLVIPAPALAARADILAGRTTLAPLVRDITPSVVNISVRGRVKEDNPLYRDPLFREFFDAPRQLEREISATGSGVIVDAERGYVLTANHVVAQVSTVQVTVKDGRQFTARLVGRDPGTDIAVLRIEGASGLKSIAMGDSDRLEVGDFVLAVGNPFGLGQTVTFGIVSALGRTGLGKQGYEDFIQTDAPINPGNSGGALVDIQGQLVGINTAILSPGGGNVGIGFAVPINMARRVMEQIVQSGRVRRGQIGIRLTDRDRAGQANRQAIPVAGALVAEIVPGSPAEQAGVHKGDIVIAVDGVPVRSAAQLRNYVGLTPVGRLVRLTLERRGAPAPILVEVRPTVEASGRAAVRPE